MTAKKILKTNKPVKQSSTKSTKTKSKETAVKKTDKKTSKPSKTNKKEKEIANIKEDKELAEKIENNVGKSTKDKTRRKVKITEQLFTNDGHKLTSKEAKFIDNYIATGNIRQSVIDAGYKQKAPGQYGSELLRKPRIMNEIDYRMREEHSNRIATGEQVMQFFTKVMNGEIKDQFGLDAPLGERIKAGQELAKRTVDIATKVAGVTQGQNEITIKLDFDRNRL